MTAIIKTTRNGKAIAIAIRGAKEDVTAAIDAELERYHPAGYGTYFSAPKRSGDEWFAHGGRMTSCD